MKKSMSLLLMVMLFVSIGTSGSALADDSGDERTIPVTEWKCWICEKQFFTFTPDSLDGKAKLQHKDPQYQQSNWLSLKDRSPIIKCPKARDGAHFFEKVRDLMTSGYVMGERIDSYIILKSGSSVNVKINRIQCVVCKREGFCFHGDDMDVANFLKVKDPANVYALRTKARVSPCDKIVLGTGRKLYPHIFSTLSTTTMSSAKIAENIAYFLYSD